MKKILALMAFVAFTANVQVQAQTTFIPKVGWTSSNVVFKDTQAGQKPTNGFLVGAGVSFPLDADGFLSLQPEVLLIQKGYRTRFSGSVNYEGNIHIRYLEIPLLAKISFGSEKIKAYVNAGPSVGIGLGGKTDGKAVSGSASLAGEGVVKFDDRPLNARFEDVYYDNRTDLGLQFGGGVGFGAGPGALLLDVRYGLGLSNLNDKQNNQSGNDNKSQHRVIAVSLGYALPLGGK